MLKGAFILGVGFSLGYAKALQDSQDIKSGLETMLDLLKKDIDARNADKSNNDSENVVVVDANAEAVGSTPTPTTEGE
jgi:hypothetical protein